MTPRTAAKCPQIRRSAHCGRVRPSLLTIVAAVAAAVGLYGLAGIYGGPWLIDRWLAQTLETEPGRSATRETVSFDPFTLEVEIGALEVRNAQTGAAFAADRLVVDFAAQSLTERRPVIESLVIERPQIDVPSLADMMTFASLARGTLFEQTRIGQFALSDGALTAGAGSERQIDWPRFDLSLRQFDAHSADASEFRLEAVTATGGDIALEGSLAASFEQAQGQLRLGAIELAAVSPRLGGIIGTTEPGGRVDVAAEFSARALSGFPTLELTDARLDFLDLTLTPVSDMTVTVDRATAAATLVFAANADDIELRGRIETNDTQLEIQDARVSPQQTFAFDDAALLMTIDPDDDGLSLVFGGQLRQAGTTALNLRMPRGSGPRRVSIVADDVPATMLTAYTNDALDRRLAAGNADLSLEFSLSSNRADGSLRIVARDLGFEAPAAEDEYVAGDSSLELAAALLEDSDGVIELDLRFAGNTGNVRDAVADALTARISAVTETPFAALAAIVDGAGSSTNAVPFLPGDAALNDRALATVAALADALNARPRLGMRVFGGYDATVDRDALARQQIELHVQLATAGPSTRARPAPVNFDSPRARDVLDEFAGERLPGERVAELARRFACEGALAEVCERAYYEQIFDALVENEDIEARTLNRLARFRAQSIINALQQRGIADERIELSPPGDGNIVETPFGVGLQVELTALEAAPRG